MNPIPDAQTRARMPKPIPSPDAQTLANQDTRNLARMHSQDARILARMPKSALWWGTKLTDGDNPQICIGIRFWFAL